MNTLDDIPYHVEYTTCYNCNRECKRAELDWIGRCDYCTDGEFEQ